MFEFSVPWLEATQRSRATSICSSVHCPMPACWTLGGMLVDVQELLGRRVDVVSDRALHPELRERILDEAQAL